MAEAQTSEAQTNQPAGKEAPQAAEEPAKEAPHEQSFLFERPIRTVDEDRYNVAGMAGIVASQVLAGAKSEPGLVVGLEAPWGCGKTSFCNLLKTELETKKATVVFYELFLISSAEELLLQNLAELCQALAKVDSKASKKDKELLTLLGQGLEAVGLVAMFAPGGSVWSQIITRAGSELKKSGERSKREIVSQLAESLKQLLPKLDRPIIFILDDVERLIRDELIQVIKVLRLMSTLPNVAFIVAYDPAAVDRVLAADGGRRFLSKFISFPLRLPSPRREHNLALALKVLKPLVRENAQRGFTAFLSCASSVFASTRETKRMLNLASNSLRCADPLLNQGAVLLVELLKFFSPGLAWSFGANCDRLNKEGLDDFLKDYEEELDVHFEDAVKACNLLQNPREFLGDSLPFSVPFDAKSAHMFFEANHWTPELLSARIRTIFLDRVREAGIASLANELLSGDFSFPSYSKEKFVEEFIDVVVTLLEREEFVEPTLQMLAASADEIGFVLSETGRPLSRISDIARLLGEKHVDAAKKLILDSGQVSFPICVLEALLLRDDREKFEALRRELFTKTIKKLKGRYRVLDLDTLVRFAVSLRDGKQALQEWLSKMKDPVQLGDYLDSITRLTAKDRPRHLTELQGALSVRKLSSLLKQLQPEVVERVHPLVEQLREKPPSPRRPKAAVS